MGKKKKEKFVDDGRTIANMNVEGTPWYSPRKDVSTNPDNHTIYTAKETWAVIKGVLGAALLIGTIIAVCFGLLILFLWTIWK